MVSQSGIEMYIVTFDYDDKCVAYLNGGSIANAGLASAKRYGLGISTIRLILATLLR